MEQNKIVVFGSKKIRRTWHNDEWYFSVVDVVEALTDSPTPRQYWGKVKQREFTDLQVSPIWVQLKLEAADGKKYITDCANTKGMFRNRALGTHALPIYNVRSQGALRQTSRPSSPIPTAPMSCDLRRRSVEHCGMWIADCGLIRQHGFRIEQC